MFRLNLYIPLIIITTLMSMLTVFAIAYVQEDTIHKNKEEISKTFIKNLNEKVKVEAAVISEYINFIQSKKDVAKLFLAQDKAQLNNAVKDIYSSLSNNVELTHMYFIKNDGTVLLRAHDYDKDKDVINRVTFEKSKDSQSLFYGLEFGLKKNYTLRVVKPWFLDGKLIGYLELGKEIDKIINELSTSLNTHIYIAVKKEFYSDAPTFIKERIVSKVKTDNYYIVYSTSTVPQEIEDILNGTINNKEITHEGIEYFTARKPLLDVSGKKLGYFVFLSDVSLEHGVMYGSIRVLSIVLAIISVILISSGYFMIQKREKSIYDLTSKLEEQKEDLALFNVKLQKIFDLQRNIVLVTDGKKPLIANRAMFDFFGFDDFDDFLKNHNCICDRFVVNDNYFHLGKVPEGESWVAIIKELPGEKRIVAMLDHDLMSHAFSVSVNEFEEGNFVVSFTDISNTMIEHSKLKRKVTHDKLTGALNREFFETNIDLIIKEMHPKKLGVVIADIDYFKKVNDTYGHNRGDVILKEFTDIIEKSIRNDDDYLIRWGGEEFLILIKVDTLKSLKKVTESIRKHIENHHFEELDRVTSSFGVTMYIEDEDVVETIARADRALYKAKKNGKNQFQVL